MAKREERDRFNSEMFSLARKIRGRTQTELSKQTGLSQGQLSRFEHGLLAPSSDNLRVIAGALQFPPEFFQMQGNLFPPLTPIHRKRASLGKRPQEKAEAVANLRRIHLQKMEPAVDIDETVPRLDSEDFGGSPQNVARAIRSAFRVPTGPVANMVDLLEDHGVFVFLEAFESRHLDGFTLIGDGLRPLVFVNEAFPGDRERLSLAHELGHIVMHSIPSANAEREAWAFAEEFLIPEESIAAELRQARKLADFADLKRKWKVSMAALIRRAKDLGIVDGNRYRYLMQLMAPYRVREPVPIPVESPSLADELIATYRQELKYSDKDLIRLLCISEETFRELYEHSKRRLRIVK